MLESLIKFSLRQRIVVLSAACLLMVAGIFSARELPIDVLPDLNRPTVTVMTEAPGMAPGEVEQQISFPIERALAGLPEVTHIRSVSGPGLSTVYARFDWNADIYRSRQLVSERLDRIADSLPDRTRPQLGPISSIMGEVMLVALHSPGRELDRMQLREIADWELRPRLLAIPGVSQVTVIGGLIRQYQVRPDLPRLQDAGIPLTRIEQVMADFSRNASGGFVTGHGSEFSLRGLGQKPTLTDLRSLPVGSRDGRVLQLTQVADVDYGARIRRGDAGFNADNAIILSVQKHPGTDTLQLTDRIEAVLGDVNSSNTQAFRLDVVFRQADFIKTANDNLADALLHASIIVILVLYLFLLDARATFISLIAIPVSILSTALVFRYLGLSINTMTLGGLAIAIGELVDDAVVGVENVIRRVREARNRNHEDSIARTILNATLEVRTAIYNATVIIVIVFIPLFALGGIEGRLFNSLGLAYIISILASLLVSVTITPVLSYYLIGRQKHYRQSDSPLLAVLKRWDRRLLERTLPHPAPVTAGLALFAVAAVLSFSQLPAAFLPSFNEGSLTVNLISRPGTPLETSNRIGVMAEQELLQIPEVRQVGRRTGRAELDDHAEGVHYSEIDVILHPQAEGIEAVVRRIRDRLAAFPAHLNIGQPISHRIDHLLATVRADMAVKLYGADLSTLHALATELLDRLRAIPGLEDVQLEQEISVPEIHVRPRPEAIQQYGLVPAELNSTVSTLVNGKQVSQVLDQGRRYDLVLRLPEAQRQPQAIGQLLINGPDGQIPLHHVAQVSTALGPNRITHENGQRRALIFGSIGDADQDRVLRQVREAVSGLELPPGYYADLEGRFVSQESGRQRLLLLTCISFLLILAVLYNRYRSFALSAMVMVNIPFCLTGGIIALWVSGNSLSLASLVGFITLAGISTRNGILKISHYINLHFIEGMAFGRELVIRGSLERLAPVLMTALVSALALIPLLISGDAPGKEILHPVAVVICGGLISSTLLDTVFTPILFYHWGEAPLNRLMRRRQEEVY
ncbi:efflux RND transporter permease subunit [Thiohalobacter thiocyanaticus]|uniref:Efflux RND transporter permease subunit n=1 Tax=Thiohalobacter thiocyanaticus TaxID=585455 RepID=A0A426QMB4_9GAMM|nr:efflux RND transporter permease subunit [Thiohalobacter thiocyanaticus]RRQ22889.1 efflux RND transporter permease subunit [Thiohalobacter thiocyanaticus]